MASQWLWSLRQRSSLKPCLEVESECEKTIVEGILNSLNFQQVELKPSELLESYTCMVRNDVGQKTKSFVLKEAVQQASTGSLVNVISMFTVVITGMFVQML